MLNLMGDLHQNTIADQQRAELYMRIYQYAAQDWVNNSDMEVFVNNVLVWMESVETRLNQLSMALQTHTHPITPHVHPIPTHTHVIPAHTHVAPTYGGPCSPTALTTSPGGPGSSSQNTELPTRAPNNSTELKWPAGTLPAKYINTTGAVTNIGGNKVSPGTSVIGSATPHMRRVMVIPESATPNIPPYLIPNVI